MKFSLRSTTQYFSRHIVGVAIAVSILLLLSGTLWFVTPRIQEVNALGGLNYDQKVTARDALLSRLAALHTLENQLEAVSPQDIQKLDGVIAKGKDVPGIFRHMQAFADEANMTLLSVNVTDGAPLAAVGETATRSYVHTQTITVSLSGQLDYVGLKNFLATVSQQAPILDLTNISHTATSGATPTTYNFTFRSYYLRQ